MGRLVPALAETFGTVANMRIRHAATVGGVLAEADYASDPPAAFLALDAMVSVLGPGGARDIPIAEFFQGFYETALARERDRHRHPRSAAASRDARGVREIRHALV